MGLHWIKANVWKIYFWVKRYEKNDFLNDVKGIVARLDNPWKTPYSSKIDFFLFLLSKNGLIDWYIELIQL